MFLVSLKGHSRLWDRGNLDTSFLTLKKFINLNQRYSSSTSGNLLQFSLFFLLDFNRLLTKSAFECAFSHPMILFVSYLVKNSMARVSVICKIPMK